MRLGVETCNLVTESLIEWWSSLQGTGDGQVAMDGYVKGDILVMGSFHEEMLPRLEVMTARGGELANGTIGVETTTIEGLRGEISE